MRTPRAIVYTIGARVLSLAARVLFLFLIASRLGAAGQGVYTHANSLAAIIAFILGSGMETSNTYHVSRNRARYLAPCYASSLLFSAAVSLASGLLIVAAIHLLPRYFDGYPPIFRWLVPLLIFGYLVQLVQNSLLLGLQQFQAYFLSTVVQYGTLTAITIALLVSDRLSLSIAMVVWVGCFWLAIAVQTVMLLRSPHLRIAALRNLSRVVRLQYRYALRTNIGSIATALTFRLDAIILRAFASYEVVGVYSVAASISETILQVPRGLASYLLPSLSTQRVQVTPAQWKRYLLVLPLLGLMALPIGWLGGWLPQILGRQEYAASAPYLRILLIGTVCMGWGMVLSSHLNALNRPELPTMASLTALAVTVVGDLAFIARWQAYGASVVSVFAYAIFAVMCAHSMLTLVRQHIRRAPRTAPAIPAEQEPVS